MSIIACIMAKALLLSNLYRLAPHLGTVGNSNNYVAFEYNDWWNKSPLQSTANILSRKSVATTNFLVLEGKKKKLCRSFGLHVRESWIELNTRSLGLFNIYTTSRFDFFNLLVAVIAE
jgi:hypothetical protein